MIDTEFLAQYPASTQQTYGRVLREFSEFLGIDIQHATSSDIIAYQKTIANQAGSTVSRKLATLASFYRYLQVSNERADDPMRGIRRPRVDAVRSIEWLTSDEIRRLLQAVNGDPRMLALVWAGLHSLRVGEITRLDVEDYSEGTLRVLGKGEKSRLVPLVPAAQDAVRNYIGTRKSGPMFITNKGRLSNRYAEYLLSRYSEAVGKRTYPHALRHTFGTNAIRAGNSTLAVQKVMGHATPQTTEKYVHLDDSDARVTVERTYGNLENPLTVIKGGKEYTSKHPTQGGRWEREVIEKSERE